MHEGSGAKYWGRINEVINVAFINSSIAWSKKNKTTKKWSYYRHFLLYTVILLLAEDFVQSLSKSVNVMVSK